MFIYFPIFGILNKFLITQNKQTYYSVSTVKRTEKIMNIGRDYIFTDYKKINKYILINSGKHGGLLL